jgi:hypothetical protein
MSKRLTSIYDKVDQLIYHRAKAVIRGADDRARRKGVPFNIKLHHVYEVLLNSNECPILGVPMTWHDGKNYDPFSRTLDRINPDLGYTPDNIWIISMRANQIKSDASLPELIKAMANLINHLYTGESDERTGTGYRNGSESQYDLDLRN